MIKKLAILTLLGFIIGCSSETEQKQRIPDGTYRPSGFHAFIDHGNGNVPISLLKDDSLYHFYYTTESNEWGHLTSPDMLSWRPAVSIALPEHGFGEVIYDENNLSDLAEPWNLIWSNGKELILSNSKDGVEWDRVSNNPILKASGIPSITWSPDLELWLLTLTNDETISIYTSSNLTNWNDAGTHQIEAAIRSSLLNLGGRWIMLSQGERLRYQLGTFDGSSFQPTSSPQDYEGYVNGTAAFLTSVDGTTLIARYKTTNEQLPTFTSPLTMSMVGEALKLSPSQTFQNQIVGKRRARLSKLLTDGPSWFSFIIEEDFEEFEMKISDNSSEITVAWDASSKTMTLSGTALAADNLIDLNINSLVPQNGIKVDVLIDHASVDLFLNDGAYSTSILTIPDTFFSKIELTLDGELYDAKGVLYDIGI